MANPIAKDVCTPVARIVVDLATVSSVQRAKETVTVMELVLGDMYVEWTTATSSPGDAVIRKMTCVLLRGRKERTVGG